MKCPIFWVKIFASAKLTICLRRHRLDSHNDHAGLGNDFFLFCLVDVPCQCRDQQGSQYGQNDQYYDQLNKRKAFFAFYFANTRFPPFFCGIFQRPGYVSLFYNRCHTLSTAR